MSEKEGEKEHPIIDKKIDRSLDLSMREGAIHSVSTGFGYSYLSPFALLINATSSQIGILYGIINLLPSISQLRASRLLEKFSPKKISLTGTFTQSFLWIFIILIGIGFYFNFPGMVWLFILFSGIIYFFLGVVQPAWFAWMGQLVPERSRGSYFSKRNAIVGIFSILSMVLAAAILDDTESFGINRGNVMLYTIIGFSIIFFVTSMTKLICVGHMRKMYQPLTKVRKKDYFTFMQFLRRAPKTPFGKYVIFRAFFSVAIGLAAPFFTVYLLRDLGLSYIWYILIIASGTFFQLIFLPLLGKVSDIYGNVKLTKISAGLMFLIPLLWYFSSFISPFYQRIYLLIIPNIVSGFAWAGYNLATNNYVYDSVSVQKRGFAASYMNLIVGISVFIGALLGSFLVSHIFFIKPILFVFLISSGARLIVFLFGVKHLKEVRPVKKFSSRFLIKEFHPLQELMRNITYLEHFVNKEKI